MAVPRMNRWDTITADSPYTSFCKGRLTSFSKGRLDTMAFAAKLGGDQAWLHMVQIRWKQPQRSYAQPLLRNPLPFG